MRWNFNIYLSLKGVLYCQQYNIQVNDISVSMRIKYVFEFYIFSFHVSEIRERTALQNRRYVEGSNRQFTDGNEVNHEASVTVVGLTAEIKTRDFPIQKI